VYFAKEEQIMFRYLWKAGVVGLVGLSLLLTPGTSEAQRGRGRSRGGNWSGGGGSHGGNWSGGGGRGGNWGGNNWGHSGVSFGIGLGYPGLYGGYGYGGYGGYGRYGYGAYDGSYYYPSTSYYYPSSSYSSFYPDSSYYSDGSQANFSGMNNPNDAGFTVRVPDPNAEVWFQDHQTQQRGVVRQYESEPLAQGYTYTFTVRARWNQNGQMMDQTRQVNARAGQNVAVDFTAPAQESIQGMPQQTQGQQQQFQGQQNMQPKMPQQNLQQQDFQQQQRFNQQTQPFQQDQNRQPVQQQQDQNRQPLQQQPDQIRQPQQQGQTRPQDQ